MKIGIIDWINREQEANVGDEIKVEGKKGKILEPDEIKIKLENGRIVTWDKDYVCHLKPKED